MRFLLSIAEGLSKLRDIPPLLFRLILAYGFITPFRMKWGNIDAFAEWLGTMDYPIPLVSAYVAMIFEGLGIIFLFFGFATRLITVPLMFLLFVAIATVHWEHGFSAADNGYEIPLYFILMLFSLFVTGPGRVSIDALFARGKRA